MTATTIPTSAVKAINNEALASLRDGLAGQIIMPSDPEYDASRTIWNGMIDKRPAAIARPAGVSDVIQLVHFAREYGLTVSIKGGGHNGAGYAVSDGGLMIDMGNINSVHVDPERRTARVGAGAIWGEFDRETSVFGLATTAGVISSTGVAGLTLGGGIGWLVGKHGLSIDNLLSVDIVTTDGVVQRASEHEHPDLFWALRGGGGLIALEGFTTLGMGLTVFMLLASGVVLYGARLPKRAYVASSQQG